MGNLVSRFSLKVQIGLIGVLGVVGLLVVGASYLTGQTMLKGIGAALQAAADARSLIQGIEIGLLEARRAEKDFLLRRADRYAEAQQRAVRTVLARLDDLETLLPRAEDGPLVSRARHGIDSYAEQFGRVIEGQRALGLDENKGMQGALRASVHSVEEQLKGYDNPRLSILMLMMRRHEKDFLARLDAKYAAEMKTRAGEFAIALERSGVPAGERDALATKMAAYQREFAALVERSVDQVGQVKRLSDLYAEFEPVKAALLAAVDARFQATKARADAVTEGTQRFMLGAIGGTIVVVLVCAFLVARGIYRPLAGMTETMARLAEGDLTADVRDRDRRDEIGTMAAAVQVFKDNAIEKKRLDEAERERAEAERRAEEAQRQREQAIGQEIAALIDAVSKGDLDRRIDLNGKDGFHKTMSGGMNRVTDTVQAVIKDLAEVLGALAQGDLTRRVTSDYQGAFQRVKEDVNATSDRLSEIVGQLHQSAEAIASAAAEVSTGSADLAERTEQQASSLEETAASMEELGATVRSNADNAQRANHMADDARKAAESGGTVAGSAIEAMKRIEDASRKITDIIGVIDEIAFQTNLLALNAAVEAARAGDAGRGFAVVAQEVRQLAQRSAQASKEIKALILDSDGQVKEGVDLVKKAGDALGGIMAGVHQVATLIAEMASASTEQASALDEINSTVAQMDEMTQKNAALVEETTAAAQAMAGQAADLQSLVGFFKLGGGARPAAVRGARRSA